MDTGAGVADDYDDLFSISIFIMDGEEGVIYLPVPGTLVAYGYNHISNDHKNNIRNHSNQSHLRLSNAPIPLRQPRRNSITQRPRRKQPNKRPNQDGKIEESNFG